MIAVRGVTDDLLFAQPTGEGSNSTDAICGLCSKTRLWLVNRADARGGLARLKLQ
jgi:hypothetical protein